MNHFDVVIIGSGLGGLLCGSILSREGYHVCVLEKNSRYGGCLQTFERDGSVFDTGIHYAGGLDKGKILHTFFNYLKLTERLKIRRLDEDGYDVVRYGGQEYKFAMGYRRFTDTLAQQFPYEKNALETYAGKMLEVSNTVNPCNVSENDAMPSKYLEYYHTSYDQFLNSTIADPVLKNVLVGLSPVYSGVRERTPLYIPMMIHSTNIDGAYRFIDGGSQLADLLVQDIRDCGGTVMTDMKVTHITIRNYQAGPVEVNGSERITGRFYISNIHPKSLFSLVEGRAFTGAFIRRINSTEETFGMFSLYLSSAGYGFKYINKNYYCYHTHDLWDLGNYSADTWPKGYMLHFSPVSEHAGRTNAIIINTYMKWDELKSWINSRSGKRGEGYETFKKKKAEKLLFLLEKDFPGLAGKVSSWYASTPLTYRDYTGTHEGSAYGILKDYRNPFKTLILPVTHIKNLLLTGQNINTHGVGGVTIGAFLTCSELLGREYLKKKVCNG
ncbi:MAG: NAD(P)/FAD-dependent oxidoreductase [Bacteroidales bacterium]|nr:NAD(P)/FAD-dependent oxidoreductase [Bacteroidales bacterium]